MPLKRCVCGCVRDLRYYRHDPDGLHFLRCRSCGRVMDEVPAQELQAWEREVLAEIGPRTEPDEAHAGHVRPLAR